MPDSSCILVVEDELIARENLTHVLEQQGHCVITAENGRQALTVLEQQRCDLVITDMRMPDMDGMELLEYIKSHAFNVEVIILTGYASVEAAVEAMRKGAYQYLSKPVRLNELTVIAEKALEKSRLRLEVARLKDQLESAGAPNIIGHSQPMQSMKESIAQVAPADCPVLVLGETGTGKELVARSLHAQSNRRAERFLAVNCASFSEELLANELFGHEKAAFTGAQNTKKGLLESADGGTFFLDEVGDMSLPMQANLLRVLETHTLLRVGGTKEIPVDVRIIAATNKDLQMMVQEGSFRQDLYYRLNVFTLNVPALSERADDILLLATYFITRFAGSSGKNISDISDEAMALLKDYPFPGNVRELENIMERAVILCHGDTIEAAHLPPDLSALAHLSRPSPSAISDDSLYFSEVVPLQENERIYLQWALERANGNKSLAAEMLDLNRGSLWRKLKRHGLAD